LEQYTKPLLDYLDNNQLLPDLPCDLTGTNFQKQVWQFLKTIPSGKTYSYSVLAKAIGKPKAVRATASACAKNQIALIIPCHRIVPESGGVGEYRWGSKLKAKLLVAER
jgi:AraC family transcriptional regulator, regulatory protein of adaptative response / methylated-DNA-[protein]-cysteine methyltransferase